MVYKAVLFDIGGVLTVSPVTRIIGYCKDNAIPDETRFAIFGPEDGPWSAFERSEIDRAGFAAAFDDYVRGSGTHATGKSFIEWFFRGFEPRPEMLAVVEALRPHYKLAAITNNVARAESAARRTSGLDAHRLFEVVVESALVGARKPEPRIFQIACERLQITPPEAVFLDDMGANLKGARSLGMTTIKVDHTLSAISELETTLGVTLPRPGAA